MMLVFPEKHVFQWNIFPSSRQANLFVTWNLDPVVKLLILLLGSKASIFSGAKTNSMHRKHHAWKTLAILSLDRHPFCLELRWNQAAKGPRPHLLFQRGIHASLETLANLSSLGKHPLSMELRRSQSFKVSYFHGQWKRPGVEKANVASEWTLTQSRLIFARILIGSHLFLLLLKV